MISFALSSPNSKRTLRGSFAVVASRGSTHYQIKVPERTHLDSSELRNIVPVLHLAFDIPSCSCLYGLFCLCSYSIQCKTT